MTSSLNPRVTLRPAVAADVAWLELWDDPAATVAFDCDWADELAQQDEGKNRVRHHFSNKEGQTPFI